MRGTKRWATRQTIDTRERLLIQDARGAEHKLQRAARFVGVEFLFFVVGGVGHFVNPLDYLVK